MTSTIFDRIVGPRVPEGLWERHRHRYLIPSACFAGAAVLLIVSMLLPYWRMTLHAPQYPGGLHVQAYVYELTGDVAEIDGLNHYIGMRPLAEAATLERSLSVVAISVLALLLIAAIFIHTKYAAFLAIPAVLFPAIFLADLAYWLRNFGTNLDPTAPLSSSIKPFVPPVLGEGVIGQFRTVALPGVGLILATVAAIVVVVGLYYHRQAYKPLVEQDKNVE